MSLPETIDLGDGFVLERSRVGDAEESARAIHDSLDHLARYMPWATPEQSTTEAQRERFARHQDEWQRSESFDYIVRLAGEQHVLGIVDLEWRHPERFGGGAIEIGYWIHVDWCNRGLATKAARALTDVALSLPEVEVVVIGCDETNAASAAIPRKLGFLLDGIADAQIEAPAQSGREMVWLRKRTPDDAVEFETSPNRTITRIGETVHRPVERWTPAVHELLRYLEAVGFDASPRVLGIDREDREILAFVPGDSGARSWAHVVSDDGLGAYARLLRRYHDAVRSYIPPPDANWSRATGAPGHGELVCHGDCGPWNVVWRDGNPVALVDFDHARPASPLDDVGYALEFSAPFRDDAECVRWLRYTAPPIAADGWRCSPRRTDSRLSMAWWSASSSSSGATSRRCAFAREGVEPQASWVASGSVGELWARVRWSEENRHLFAQ